MTIHQPGATDPKHFPEALVAVSSDCLLELTGPDALKFLQGQTSADFAKAAALDVLDGCFCDVKGRVLADFLAVVASPERILLRVSADLAAQLQAHLEKYLMFSKASLNTSELAIYGALGTTTVGALAPILTSDSVQPNGPQSTGFAARRAVIRADGFALRLDDARALVLTAETPNPAVPTAPDDHWQAAAITSGEARVRANTWGKYLPQDLNYDLRGMINFKKGCYTGQEVIARLHWRGTPKRRLYLATLPAAAVEPPDPGAPLYTEGKDNSVGSITNAIRVGESLITLIETTEDGSRQALRCHGLEQPLTVTESLD